MRPIDATIKYISGVSQTSLQLTIIGRDPFPTDPIGIPFCKPTWEQQLESNCSGRNVLLSLGIDLDAAEKEFKTPSGLFESLRSDGIIFLNASYEFIDGKIRKYKHLKYLSDAWAINEPFINISTFVLYCGEANKIKWVAPINNDCCVVHPDIRNKINKYTSEQWKDTWSQNAIRETLGLTISSPLIAFSNN